MDYKTLDILLLEVNQLIDENGNNKHYLYLNVDKVDYDDGYDSALQCIRNLIIHEYMPQCEDEA